MKHTDIDIDVADREELLSHLNYIDASIINDNIIKKHNVGVYLQEMPTYLDTNLATIDYKGAGDYGYFKLDILNNSVYENVNDEEHLNRLLSTEPEWSMLVDDNVIPSLFQLSRHGDMLKKWKPKNVLELAMFIAMIRPSKKHLLERNSWDEVKDEVWIKPENDEQYFKKSHSIAYAMVIKVQLNLINDF